MLRGWNEEVLSVDIVVDQEAAPSLRPTERMIAAAYNVGDRLPGDRWLLEVIGWTWRVKLSLSLSLDLMRELRERAEEEAIRVFARNLKDLLLAAPAGSRATMGLDPGIRTGVKVAVVDGTGKLLDTATVYPFPPKNDIRGTQAVLAALVRKHKVELIAIGNGTGSRETEKLVADMLAAMPAPKPTKVIVSEAGASSIPLRNGGRRVPGPRRFPAGRRLDRPPAAGPAGRARQDRTEVDRRRPVPARRRPVEAQPLARCRCRGCGERRWGRSQHRLGAAPGACLGAGQVLGRGNRRAPGCDGGLRQPQGTFESAASRRAHLRQCAGFLRIPNGSEPLDASAVHPEAYGVAKKIVAVCGRDVRSLMADSAELKKLDPRIFVDERFGLPTVKDILAELEKPGRDPRPSFKTATFAEGVDDIKDLKVGMRLEGTVTNVAAFGAFVDIGVHQDGLVHVSQLADRFVKDPHEVVKAGDVVQVRVTEVDVARKRIGLSMRKEGGTDTPREARGAAPKGGNRGGSARSQTPQEPAQGAFGAALWRR